MHCVDVIKDAIFKSSRDVADHFSLLFFLIDRLSMKTRAL